jgi:hypothetical protein
MSQANRRRYRYTFWLDHLNPTETEIAGLIQVLKAKRTFAKNVRNGLRLMHDLSQGRLEVLFELFPWVRAEILEYIYPSEPPKSPFEVDLQYRLERMEQLLLERNKSTANTVPQLTPLSTGSIKSLSVPQLTMPTSDDEDTIVIQRDALAETSINTNFLEAAFGFQQARND